MLCSCLRVFRVVREQLIPVHWHKAASKSRWSPACVTCTLAQVRRLLFRILPCQAHNQGNLGYASRYDTIVNFRLDSVFHSKEALLLSLLPTSLR